MQAPLQHSERLDWPKESDGIQLQITTNNYICTLATTAFRMEHEWEIIGAALAKAMTKGRLSPGRLHVHLHSLFECHLMRQGIQLDNKHPPPKPSAIPITFGRFDVKRLGVHGHAKWRGSKTLVLPMSPKIVA